MRTILVFVLLACSLSSFAQKVENLPSLKQKQPFDNIATQEMYTDSSLTGNVIWIKREVLPHYHANHVEQVMVIEGEGQLLLGHQTFFIKPGDLIYIPKGTIHAVRVTSKLPMKVLSIQTPQFDGSDRVMVQPTGW